jgi:DNA binding domain, excisionase family
MNSSHVISIILRHLIPALQAIERDLLEADRGASYSEPPTKRLAEDSGAKPRRFLKLAEAAAFLNVSKALLYKLTSSRKIPYYKVGTRVMFSEEQLLTWVKAFEHTPDEISSRSRRRN